MFKAIGRKFREGDTVITFNYEATVEASLWAARNRHFGDGCGIAIDMTSKDMKSVLRSTRFRAPSPVKVLKPHGSINWAKSINQLVVPSPAAEMTPDVASRAGFRVAVIREKVAQ